MDRHPAPRQRGGGTIRKAQRVGWWEGRGPRRYLLRHLLRRQRSSESDAPSTAQKRGPPPPLPRGRISAIVLAMRLHPSFTKGFTNGLPKKGGGAPIGAPSIGRITPCGVAASKCFGCGSGLSGDRSPFGAPPRRLRRKSMPPLSPGRVSRGLAGEGVTSAISRGYSDAPRAPVVMPADRCPDRPGAGLQAPPAGTAPAPSLGCHRSTSLRWAGFGVCN